MKFKISAKASDGTDIIHYFDNISLDITTEKGIPVVLKEDPRCQQLLSSFTKDVVNNTPKHKKDIENIRITLGFDCNFHCKYCHERRLAESLDKKVIPIEERTNLDERVENLVNRIVTNLPNLKSVTFWGGEPLVYLKAMKKITKLLKEKLPHLDFSTITNGALLTLPVAKWLAENEIKTTISHDGPSFNTYRNDIDPLTNPKTLEGIQYLFEVAKENPRMLPHFNIVVTPENCDLQQFEQFFISKLGHSAPFHFESIVRLDAFSKNIVTPFDEKTSKTLLNNIVAFGSTEDNLHPVGSIRDNVTYILRRLVSKSPLPDISCFIASSKYIALDMNGNVLICHGAPESYCKLEDLDNTNFTIKHSWKEREDCKNCPVLLACIGGCSCQDKIDHDTACANLKLWHSGHFIAAWKILFNATIYRIEPCEENENANSN